VHVLHAHRGAIGGLSVSPGAGGKKEKKKKYLQESSHKCYQSFIDAIPVSWRGGPAVCSARQRTRQARTAALVRLTVSDGNER
jgi:hypothetical protein